MEFKMLTENNNSIDYESNINPLISGVVPDFLFIKENFTFNFFNVIYTF